MPKIIKRTDGEYLVKHYSNRGRCYAGIVKADTEELVKQLVESDLGKYYPYNEATGVWMEGKPRYF